MMKRRAPIVGSWGDISVASGEIKYRLREVTCMVIYMIRIGNVKWEWVE